MHIQPYSQFPCYNVVATDTAIVAIMTEVFINFVSGEGGRLYEVYMKMFQKIIYLPCLSE